MEAKKAWPNDAAIAARTCEREAFDAHENPFFGELFERSRWGAWIVPAVTIPFAWLFVLLIVEVVRWVRSGFRSSAEGKK